MAVIEFNVKINVPLVDALEDALDDSTMTEISQLLAKKCDPYVPYRTGKLSKNITVNAKGVTYNQPYAEKNYYGVDIPHNLTYPPLATAKWDEAMMRDRGDEFLKEVEDIVIRRLNEEINAKRG